MENDEDNEVYSSLEEYFLDCARYGQDTFIRRDEQEMVDCLKDGVDIMCVDKNKNTPIRMLV